MKENTDDADGADGRGLLFAPRLCGLAVSFQTERGIIAFLMVAFFILDGLFFVLLPKNKML